MSTEQKREGGSSTGGHTPGPWQAFERPMSIEILCSDRHAPAQMPSAGIRVADIRFKRHGRGGSFSKSVADEANASLIAAAPDMLAALQLTLKRLGELNRDDEAGMRTVISVAISAAVGDRPAAAQPQIQREVESQ